MSEPESFLRGQVVLHCGDCLDVVRGLPNNSFDSVVTDPPYALVSIVKRFGGANSAPAKGDVYARASAGFMGKQWDTGETAFAVEFWAEILRVLKPGAHVAAFSGTRTYHRLACAIEDAGFEIRDQLAWVYGTGFPKSHDVSKAIDKAEDAKGSFGEPKSAAHAGWIDRGRMRGDDNQEGWQRPWMTDPEAVDNAARKYIPATDAARQWEGWGTALKPAWEPIVLARKALLEKTVAANVLRWGVGALNIDGCRVNANSESDRGISEGARRAQCPVHSVRGVRKTDAPTNGANQTREVADDMRSEMPRGKNAWAGESELDRRIVVRNPDGLSQAEGGQIVGIGQGSFAYADASGLFGTPPSDGASSGTSVASRGERSSHQWEQDGQSNRELDADRLDISRAGTREDRAHDDGAEEGKRDASRCTCGKDVTGRWPANLCHDGSPEVLAGFPETTSGSRRGGEYQPLGFYANAIGDRPAGMERTMPALNGDSGSAARFFYCAKASKADRAGSEHPTVKPVKLMQWLCRLITPPGGTVLDPFAGTGTTGEAAWREGFQAVLIEREAEYQADIRRRMALIHATRKQPANPSQSKPGGQATLFDVLVGAL